MDETVPVTGGKIDHPARGCQCPRHQAYRAYARKYMRDYVAARKAKRLWLAGKGATASEIMDRTRCTYPQAVKAVESARYGAR